MSDGEARRGTTRIGAVARTAMGVPPSGVVRQQPLQRGQQVGVRAGAGSTTTSPAVACGTKTVRRPFSAASSARKLAHAPVRSDSDGSLPVSIVSKRVFMRQTLAAATRSRGTPSRRRDARSE